ncbi:unnamed protein product [Debaryomyces tyrocola]|nr:unnamed protein product [Debaryomyces tyrocola]
MKQRYGQHQKLGSHL